MNDSTIRTGVRLLIYCTRQYDRNSCRQLTNNISTMRFVHRSWSFSWDDMVNQSSPICGIHPSFLSHPSAVSICFINSICFICWNTLVPNPIPILIRFERHSVSIYPTVESASHLYSPPSPTAQVLHGMQERGDHG